MVISTGSHGQRQMSLVFDPKPAPRPQPKESVFARASLSAEMQIKEEISAKMLGHSECALTKIFASLEKASEAGAPYFRTELAKILLLGKPPEKGGRAHLDAIPSKSQVRDAYALLSMLERRRFYAIPKTDEDLKWRHICPEHQATMELMEHFSNISLISCLSGLLNEGRYLDFLLVFDSVENEARERATARREFGKPRVAGHEIRLLLEMRAENVYAKVEALQAEEERKH